MVIEVSTSTAGIYSDIFTHLASNESLFPSLPETTIRLRETFSDPSCNIAEAAKLLKADPGLTAFIMRIANSVRFMSLFPPKDLESALRRIGLTTTAELATTFAIKASFTTSRRELQSLFVESYRQSTRVAVLSYYLAAKVSKLNPSKAMLAGLLQDISVPLILTHLCERPALFNDPGRRVEAIDNLAPLVGVLILKKWDFSKELIEAVRSRKQWLREAGKRADLGDILLIARLHALMGSSEAAQCPSIVDLPAYRKLPLGQLTPDHSLALLEEAKEEIDELGHMLA